MFLLRWKSIVAIISITGMILLLSVLCAYWLIFSFNSSIQSQNVSLRWIESYMRLQIPADAKDVEIHGETGGGGYDPYFSLRFRASPNSVAQYVQGICGGVLHQGYDPFNAIDTGDIPPMRPYLIKLRNFTYYSYSPNVSGALWGNRCMPWDDGMYQILVDKSQAEEYQVMVDFPDDCEVVAACQPIGENYIRPSLDLPLIIIGLAQLENEYLLISSEICIETQLDYVLVAWQGVPKWEWLAGAQVQVKINETILIPAVVSDNGRLRPTNTQTDDFEFNYCVTNSWSPGIHQIEMIIDPLDGTPRTYVWDFVVTEQLPSEVTG